MLTKQEPEFIFLLLRVSIFRIHTKQRCDKNEWWIPCKIWQLHTNFKKKPDWLHKFIWKRFLFENIWLATVHRTFILHYRRW